MSYTCLSVTNPKARKDHSCVFCDLTIAKGEVHDRTDSIFDGEFQKCRAHLKCREITKDWEEWEFENSEPGEFREIYLKEVKNVL